MDMSGWRRAGWLALAGWLCVGSASAQGLAESERAFFEDGDAELASADPADAAAEASRLRQRLVQMLEEARSARDIIRVTCVNDKLTQATVLVDRIDAARREGASPYQRSVLRAVGERLARLEREADQCVGEDIFETGTTRVTSHVEMEMARFTGPSIELDAATRRETTARFRDVSEDTRLAQAQAPPLPQSAGAAQPTPTTGGEPILVYRASVSLAVHAIDERQQQVLALASELGGFLHEQTENAIVIRVPAPRFEEALERIDALGDVLARRIEVEDVGEEHRDLHIRLENAEHTRDRLLTLLERASAVDDVLAVQRELERVTLEIEQIRGRLRFLDDRIAMSMIRVAFEAAPRDDAVGDDVRLPVPWLEQLGLGSLLRFDAPGGRSWQGY